MCYIISKKIDKLRIHCVELSGPGSFIVLKLYSLSLPKIDKQIVKVEYI
jgi:hypothetical protein